MTTDCIEFPQATLGVKLADRHLRQSLLAAAIAIIFVFPGVVSALALIG
jgi:hypothetical protein